MRNFLATPLLFIAAIMNAAASHLAYWGARITGLTDEEIDMLDSDLF
jgi:hypothetical protein